MSARSPYLVSQLIRSLGRPGLIADHPAVRSLGVAAEIAGKEMLKTSGAMFDRACQLEPAKIDAVHIIALRGAAQQVMDALAEYDAAVANLAGREAR